MIDRCLWPLVGAVRMRALDACTIDEVGIPGEVLMETAGRAVVDRLLVRVEGDGLDPDSPVHVVCGTGNNGGDGLVVARHLHQVGRSVTAHVVGERTQLVGIVLDQLHRAEAIGVRTCFVPDGALSLPAMGTIVDAIFGTGLAREVTGAHARGIESINDARQRGAFVLAVDLPSGIDADLGTVLGVAVEAHETVTIGLPKVGLALPPGRSRSGSVFVARIGIVDALPDEGTTIEPVVSMWTRAGVAESLPARADDGHKGRFGHVLVVAGSEGKTGAAALAAHAAMRTGSGLVTLACAGGLNGILEVKCTEAMTAPVGVPDALRLGEDAIEPIIALANERDVVALGPGIGATEPTRALVRALCERIAVPLVIDADGLNAAGRELGLFKGRAAATVLTPHPGEAARLLGVTAAEINQDRLGAARSLAAAAEATVVLKGAGTVVADVHGRVRVNPTGNPALGSGGTGDVLTGVVASLIGQGLEPFDAASLAAYLHGAAADGWSESNGDAGLAAMDLTEALPSTSARLREGVAVGMAALDVDMALATAGGGRVERTLVPFPFGL